MLAHVLFAAAGAAATALTGSQTTPAGACDGILFTAYTTAPGTNGTCKGPSTTTCFPYGKCAVLARPAYSWSSIGGNNNQGYVYSKAGCSGDYLTEHFDANGVCFDPSGLGGKQGSTIQSFCVAPGNAKCAPVSTASIRAIQSAMHDM